MKRRVDPNFDQRRMNVRRRWKIADMARVFRLRRTAGEKIECPTCKDGLNLRPDGQGARCEGCREGFDVIGLLAAARSQKEIRALSALEQTRTPKEASDRATGDLFGGAL